jgi:hypothetical protein
MSENQTKPLKNNYKGRPKGAANLSTQQLADKLSALGCDPLEGMALIAMDVNNPIELRGKMYSELTQYIHPKRRAVETVITEVKNESVEDLKAKVAVLLAKTKV